MAAEQIVYDSCIPVHLYDYLQEEIPSVEGPPQAVITSSRDWARLGEEPRKVATSPSSSMLPDQQLGPESDRWPRRHCRLASQQYPSSCQHRPN